jgi:hypothetical protein
LFWNISFGAWFSRHRGTVISFPVKCNRTSVCRDSCHLCKTQLPRINHAGNRDFLAHTALMSQQREGHRLNQSRARSLRAAVDFSFRKARHRNPEEAKVALPSAVRPPSSRMRRGSRHRIARRLFSIPRMTGRPNDAAASIASRSVASRRSLGENWGHAPRSR